jgi:hypothetical protein
MARPTIDDNEEKPLDPAVEKVRRKLVRFVAINLGLLFLALMAALAAIVYKTNSENEAPAVAGNEVVPSPAESGVMTGDILLPAGARLVSHSLSGNRITLDAELASGGRAIFLYDIAERRIIGRFDLKSE